MKFTVEITLGNAGMQSNDDVRRALEIVSREIVFGDARTRGDILDMNGESVGHYRLSDLLNDTPAVWLGAAFADQSLREVRASIKRRELSDA